MIKIILKFKKKQQKNEISELKFEEIPQNCIQEDERSEK